MEMGVLSFQSTNLQRVRKITNRGTLILWWTGIQHIAIATDDIIKTISQLKAVEFFVCSTSYILSGDSRTIGRP
jgi:4-hydroxyphenylpyruvate dioxygenase-like putative hemolysin